MGKQRRIAFSPYPDGAYHPSTRWILTPSQKFDAICFLNALVGDPFYMPFYEQDYRVFEPQMEPKHREALARLKRVIKDENGFIISTLVTDFLDLPGFETLGDLPGMLQDEDLVINHLMSEPHYKLYFKDSDLQIFPRIREDLLTTFEFLEKKSFAQRWQDETLPRIQDKIREAAAIAAAWDIVPVIESHLGFPLVSDEARVYVLNYTHPHGMRLHGSRFICDVRWPPHVVCNTAIHELMHPPFHLSGDEELREAMGALEQDPFVARHFSEHNPDFGYNSFPFYFEENCVQALDQRINSIFSLSREPRSRWREADGGMHVLAAALHHLMEVESYDPAQEFFRDFVVGNIQNGRLSPGNVEPLYKAMMESGDGAK